MSQQHFGSIFQFDSVSPSNRLQYVVKQFFAFSQVAETQF